MPEGSCRCSRAPGELPAGRETGRSRSNGTGCARSPTSQPGWLAAREPQPQRDHRRISRGARPAPRLGDARAVLDGEIVAFDEAGPPELRAPAAADARDLAARPCDASPPSTPVDVRDLRPAVPRRALADGAALRRAPRRAGGARAARPRVAGSGGPRGEGRRCSRPRQAGPGGGRRQAPGLSLRARPAHRSLAQGQAHRAARSS